MDDAPTVGVRDRLTGTEIGAEQLAEGERPGPAGLAALVVGAGRLGERPALDEPHRVEGLRLPRGSGQFIDGHDARMLEPAGEAGFPEESGLRGRIDGPRRLELLQRYLAAQV